MEWIREIGRQELFQSVDGQPVVVSQVVMAAGLLLVGMVVSGVLTRLLGRRLRMGRLRPDAALVVEKVVYYLLVVAVALTAMRLVHIPITAFAFLGGAIAIGVGFGAQNIINNFISGWILIAERPVRIGDLVEVGGYQGRVENIGARCTRVRRFDGVDLLLPNSHLLENPVVNWTLVDDHVRSILRVGVAYGSPAEETARLMKQAAMEHADVLQKPEPEVFFEDFGDNAMIFSLYFWARAVEPRKLRQVSSDLRFRIDRLFRESGLVIAFPQRDVHLDTLKPLEVRVVGEPGSSSR